MKTPTTKLSILRIVSNIDLNIDSSTFFTKSIPRHDDLIGCFKLSKNAFVVGELTLLTENRKVYILPLVVIIR